MNEKKELESLLAELKTQHRELGEKIAGLMEEAAYDQILMQRLKKQKLTLRDKIASIETKLVPDIIA
jgi:hypothetical protein